MSRHFPVCILPGKPPLDATLLGVSAQLPSVDHGREDGTIWQSPIKALTIENADFDFSSIGPTDVLWGVVEDDTTQERLRFLDSENRLEAFAKVRRLHAYPERRAAPIEHHRSGRLRMLAVCSEKRVSVAPEIPTAIEAGLPGMVVENFNAVLAPGGTPKAVIDQLNAATLKTIADAEFQKRLRNVGADPVTDSTLEKAARFVQSEIQRWTPV